MSEIESIICNSFVDDRFLIIFVICSAFLEIIGGLWFVIRSKIIGSLIMVSGFIIFLFLLGGVLRIYNCPR